MYLLVSDYKSSHRDIDPTRLWYGLQLQLLLYLQAACEGLDGNPAGAFYFTIQDPMVDTADVKESAEKAIAKKLHLKGIVLADVDVVEALDSNPGYSFTKIFNADSSVASSSDGYVGGNGSTACPRQEDGGGAGRPHPQRRNHPVPRRHQRLERLPVVRLRRSLQARHVHPRSRKT